MKRAAAVISAFLILVAMLFGCSGEEGDKATVSQPNDGPASLYDAYTAMKDMAFDNVTTAVMERDPELYMELEPMIMKAGMADLAVLPIIAVGGAEESLFKLESFKYTQVDVQREGEDYVITYKAPDGESYVQTLAYDSSLDSIDSRVADTGGKETALFECIRTGEGHTAQYYFWDDEEYPWVTVYVDSDTAAFGFGDPGDKPEPLALSAALGLDYVKNCGTYLILEGNKLTISANG